MRGIMDIKTIEKQIKNQELNTRKELEDAYNTIYEEMQLLRKEFEKNTKLDKKLAEDFKNNDCMCRYTSILVAGSILGGIQLRNICRENGKLNDSKERIPYNEKQIEMIDQYNSLQNILDRLEYYAEYIFEDEKEIE